ncbi:CDP-diacylglycerol--glycerol-3-phosphate 3-phosphatidyltransferase [Cricetibacter osteomyelitidis]|uniref:CDP-diacylglycerol--glycerol-3-phosphate 3-phosphatidyltransferase n=1 Tax=Cricetibacter osteomyelitidis TaxID=1521931 RepID=A0A4R2TBJ5_9PAST|nr:CDP-alcohol phosphatidyltransferase family protein [Cricetibacter osteomyelitidis]TCP92132.1 CDP-diacylglycerol--glycerol-3-phosphate 3-phosphatidyltransferase [Cricetibacter osteomyelitidis]
MSIYALKPKFQNLLRPIANMLDKRGISANKVTLFAFWVSLFIGIFLSLFSFQYSLFWLLPFWLFLRMAFNAIDGMLAREFHWKSPLGGYLNEITDVVADAAIYLPFAFIAPFNGFQIGLFIFLSAMTEFCGVLGQAHGNGRRYDGPFGKSDRAFFIGVLALWYAIFGQFHFIFGIIMWLACLALILTCYKRVKNGLA